MDQIISRIRKTIFRVAEHEDRDLNVICDKGIFYMPDMAFAYLAGREISRNKEEIFESLPYTWSREFTLDEYGVAAAIFESSDPAHQSILIQFKMRDTFLSYVNDIKDLRRQRPGKYRKLFCAVVEVFEQQYDNYFQSLKEAFGSEAALLGTTRPFYTWSERYKQQIVYIIGLWEVLPEGEQPLTVTTAVKDIDHSDLHYLDTSI